MNAPAGGETRASAMRGQGLPPVPGREIRGSIASRHRRRQRRARSAGHHEGTCSRASPYQRLGTLPPIDTRAAVHGQSLAPACRRSIHPLHLCRLESRGRARGRPGSRGRSSSSLSTSLTQTAGAEVIGSAPLAVSPSRGMLTNHEFSRVPPDGAITSIWARACPATVWRGSARRSIIGAIGRDACLAHHLARAPGARLPSPLGLGSLLVGREPPFPLARAVPAIVDLAQAGRQRSHDRGGGNRGGAARARTWIRLPPVTISWGVSSSPARAWTGQAAQRGARQAPDSSREPGSAPIVSASRCSEIWPRGTADEPLHDLADTLERGAGAQRGPRPRPVPGAPRA